MQLSLICSLYLYPYNHSSNAATHFWCKSLFKMLFKQIEISLKICFFTVPGAIKNLKVHLPEHNVINATCEHLNPTDFNGPRKDYIARLYGDGVPIKTLNQTKCEFEFKDLSYSTKYELKVCMSQTFGFPTLLKLYSSYFFKCYISWWGGLLCFQVTASNGKYKGKINQQSVSTSCMWCFNSCQIVLHCSVKWIHVLTYIKYIQYHRLCL